MTRTLKHEVVQTEQQIVVGEPHQWWHTAKITGLLFTDGSLIHARTPCAVAGWSLTAHTAPRFECWLPLTSGDQTVPGAEPAEVLWRIQHATPLVVVVLDHINHVITCRGVLDLACANVAGPRDLWRGISESTAGRPQEGLQMVWIPSHIQSVERSVQTARLELAHNMGATTQIGFLAMSGQIARLKAACGVGSHEEGVSCVETGTERWQRLTRTNPIGE